MLWIALDCSGFFAASNGEIEDFSGATKLSMQIIIISIVIIIIAIIIIVMQISELKLNKWLKKIAIVPNKDFVFDGVKFYIDPGEGRIPIKYLRPIGLKWNAFKSKVKGFFDGTNKIENVGLLSMANALAYESSTKIYTNDVQAHHFRLLKIGDHILICSDQRSEQFEYPIDSFVGAQEYPRVQSQVEHVVYDNSEKLERVSPNYWYEPCTWTAHYI